MVDKIQPYTHSLKEIIMITKIYPITTIDITQIIDSTFNQNLYFSILKYTKWIEVNWNGPN